MSRCEILPFPFSLSRKNFSSHVTPHNLCNLRATIATSYPRPAIARRFFFATLSEAKVFMQESCQDIALLSINDIAMLTSAASRYLTTPLQKSCHLLRWHTYCICKFHAKSRVSLTKTFEASLARLPLRGAVTLLKGWS